MAKWIGEGSNFTIGNIKRTTNITSYAFEVKNSSGTVQCYDYAYDNTRWFWSGPSSVNKSANYTAYAYINFNSPGSKSNTATQTVEYRQPITGISGLSGSIGLNVGTTANGVTGANGSYTKAISVQGTNPYSTSWTGSATGTNVVTVTSSGSNNSNFVITAVNNGTSTVKASCTVATNGLEAETSLDVTVAKPSTEDVSLNVGGTYNSWGNASGTSVTPLSGDTTKVLATVSDSKVTANAVTAGTVITLTGSDGSKWSRKFIVIQQSGAGYATSSATTALVTASTSTTGGTVDINPGDTIWVSSSFLSGGEIAEDGTTKLTKGSPVNNKTPFTVNTNSTGSARIKLSGTNASSLYINLNIAAITLDVA